MSFRDYSTNPSANTALGDGTYIGPNMLRNKVRPALQQFAADGRELYDDVLGLGIVLPSDRAGKYIAFDVDGNPVASSGTGADAGLRTDLAANTGGQLVGYERPSGVPQSVYNFISREKTTPLEYGAVGDGNAANAAADTAALALAVASGKRVRIPSGFTFRINASIQGVSGMQIEGDGGIIDHVASAGQPYLFRLGLGGSISQAAIRGVNFTSSSDVGFHHIIRLVPDVGETLDQLDFSDNTILYTPATGPGAGDRWYIAGTGGGNRYRLKVNRNFIDGPMQLVATPGGSGTLRWFEFNDNWLHNCRSNAISLLSIGDIGGTNTVQDGQACRNHIWAEAYTAIGIAFGIDSPTPAANLNAIIRNLLIAENNIQLSGVPNAIGINANIGNLASTIGGFDSVADMIHVVDNKSNAGVRFGINVGTGVGTAKYTNFVFDGQRRMEGDLIFSSLADGALIRNNDCPKSNIRMGGDSGRVESEDNHYSNFVPITSDAQFNWHGRNDHFVGSATDVLDRVIRLNPAASKTQTFTQIGGSIDSFVATPGNRWSKVETSGAGTAAAHLYGVKSETAWQVDGGGYERTTGTITDYTGGSWFTYDYVIPSLALGASSPIQTVATVLGVAAGDKITVRTGQELDGMQVVAWVSAADTVKFYVTNPSSNPNGIVNKGNTRFFLSYERLGA